ncbi:hypothetical protein CT018_23555 [Salmonella enterica]|nr:hypothetical protein [Salmonella enterica]
MKTEKEESIKEFLLNNQDILKEILTRRKYSKEAAEIIIREMTNIDIKEVQPMRCYSTEKYSNIFEINIDTPKGIYKDKFDIFKNKTLFRALSIEEEKRTITESLCNPSEIKRPIKRL